MASTKRRAFSAGNGTLKLTLEDVWSLKLHERVLPEFIRNLKISIAGEKVLRDPVIVDEKTLVVLDGMHRVVALRELGYSHIPCCLVDYMLPAIQLGAWYRVATGVSGIETLMEKVKSSFSALRLVKTGTNLIDKDVNKGRGIGAFQTSAFAWLITADKKMSCKEAYDSIYLIEERLRSENLKIGYQTESDAKAIILHDKSAICLVVPTLTKKDVLRFATKGEVFAPKATRHVFPVRILGLNVPLELLESRRLTLEEANEKLNAALAIRKLMKLPGGEIVDGRRYEEPIYLFQD